MRKIAASLLFLVLPLVSMAATPDEPAGTAPQEKEWTLLVFLNGHNNLDSYGKADRKSTRLNSSHVSESRMPSSA